MLTILRFICRAITVLQFIFITTMTIVMVSLVVTRYLFSFSPAWSEELTRYLMVWMVMLGAAVLALFEDHITLYLVKEKLNPTWQRVHANIVRMIVIFASGITAWTGFRYAFSMNAIRATGLNIPLTWPTMAVPVGMTLIVFFTAYLFIREFPSIHKSNFAKMPQQKEFMDGSFKINEQE